ncbi:hypothetical protein ACFTUC_40135 [Streptomyces sp. NPDC056944]|uniref:hypothetical protein n=1 Tax=Streptomyces sp. NPDC056944 TaxID=3345972 RepID=UPI0036399ACD
MASSANRKTVPEGSPGRSYWSGSRGAGGGEVSQAGRFTRRSRRRLPPRAVRCRGCGEHQAGDDAVREHGGIGSWEAHSSGVGQYPPVDQFQLFPGERRDDSLAGSGAGLGARVGVGPGGGSVLGARLDGWCVRRGLPPQQTASPAGKAAAGRLDGSGHCGAARLIHRKPDDRCDDRGHFGEAEAQRFGPAAAA